MLIEKTVQRLADKHGWTATYLEGYVNGKTARRRGDAPSTFELIGIDEYCLGYRAGQITNSQHRCNPQLSKTQKQDKTNPVQDQKTSPHSGLIWPQITGLKHPQIHMCDS